MFDDANKILELWKKSKIQTVVIIVVLIIMIAGGTYVSRFSGEKAKQHASLSQKTDKTVSTEYSTEATSVQRKEPETTANNNSGNLCDIAKDQYEIECMEEIRGDQQTESIAGQIVWDPNHKKWRKQLKFFNGAQKTWVTNSMINCMRNAKIPDNPGDPWKPVLFIPMASDGVVFTGFQ